MRGSFNFIITFLIIIVIHFIIYQYQYFLLIFVVYIYFLEFKDHLLLQRSRYKDHKFFNVIIIKQLLIF